MPVALLHAFAEMLPRVLAEESMRTAQAIAFGFGSMAKDDARKWQRELRNQMRGTSTPPQYSSPADVAHAMGLKVVRNASE